MAADKRAKSNKAEFDTEQQACAEFLDQATPETRNPKPETLDPNPAPRDPKPDTGNMIPGTRGRKHDTGNRKLETRNYPETRYKNVFQAIQAYEIEDESNRADFKI